MPFHRKLADRDDRRLMSQNNRFIGVWMSGSFTDPRWGGGEVRGKKRSLILQMCPRMASLRVQFSFSVIPSLCDPIECSMPGLPSIANSQSLLKLMSIEPVIPSNHLVLCHPLLLPPSIFSSIRVFSNESALHIRWPKY